MRNKLLPLATALAVALAGPALSQDMAKSNQFWWPDQLDLSSLRQHGAESNPLGKDFDYAKPMAAINTAKTVSDMQLSKAKNAMIRGDQEAMGEAIKNATEVWPTNPKLTELGGMIHAAEKAGVALVPLLFAAAVPSGRMLQAE